MSSLFFCRPDSLSPRYFIVRLLLVWLLASFLLLWLLASFLLLWLLAFLLPLWLLLTVTPTTMTFCLWCPRCGAGLWLGGLCGL